MATKPLNAPPPYSGDAYPPPQPGYQPQPSAFPAGSSQTHVTAVVTQPAVVVQQRLGEHPVTVTCPTGGHQVTTVIHYENGTMVWVIAAVICFVLGFCFAWIPFLINDLKDVVHTCPIDGTVIGVYKRM